MQLFHSISAILLFQAASSVGAITEASAARALESTALRGPSNFIGSRSAKLSQARVQALEESRASTLKRAAARDPKLAKTLFRELEDHKPALAGELLFEGPEQTH